MGMNLSCPRSAAGDLLLSYDTGLFNGSSTFGAKRNRS
jgi:hypothetical protein